MQNDFNNPVSRKKAMEKAVKEANEDQKNMMLSPDKREEGGAMCGGVISTSMNKKNVEKYGIWADAMSYVLPDAEFKKYTSYLKNGYQKEASEIFNRYARSQI